MSRFFSCGRPNNVVADDNNASSRKTPILKFVKAAQEKAGFEPLIEEALQNLKITQIYPED